MDGYQVLSVHVRPLQYSAAQQEVLDTSNIMVSLKLVAKPQAQQDEIDISGSQIAAAGKEAFGNLLLNPGRRVSLFFWLRLFG